MKIDLMLPPEPGTGKAHPAFLMKHWRFDVYIAKYETAKNSFSDIKTIDGISFNLTAAAAIAHYWECEKKIWRASAKTSKRRAEMLELCAGQHFKWSQIAAGSRAYDNCKIVEYKP